MPDGQSTTVLVPSVYLYHKRPHMPLHVSFRSMLACSLGTSVNISNCKAIHMSSQKRVMLFCPFVIQCDFWFVCVFTVLPREVLMYIFRWVVSSDLDMRALEQLSLVCRGFYICARWVSLSQFSPGAAQ